MKRYFQFSTPDDRGYKLLVDPDADAFQSTVATTAGFDEVPQLLWRILRPGDTLLDLGANIGTVAIPMAIKGVCVHAVDILADNLASVQAAAECNNVPIRTYRYAIWDRDGEVSISGTSAWAQVTESGSVTIAAMTIDTLVAQYNIGPVTAVKMDIEGAELEAMRGAADLIRREKPDIVLESNVLCYGRRHSVFDLLAPLWQAGYRLYRLRKDLLCPIQSSDVQEIVYCDYLSTMKSDAELRSLTGYEVRSATDDDLIQSILWQTFCPQVHQLYISAISDSLPRAVRQDSRVSALLKDWESEHSTNELSSMIRWATWPAGHPH